MADNTINSDLIRGHIDTIILRSLYDGDKHGNEICLDIEDKSGGQYELKQPTLYSALKRLETSGYVTGYWQSGVGGRRRYFKLTDSGKKLCDESFSNWIHSRNVIDKLLTDGGDLGYVFEDAKPVKPKFNADDYKDYSFSPIPDAVPDDDEFITTEENNHTEKNDSIYTSSVIYPTFGHQIIKQIDDTDEETQRLAKDNEHNLSFLSKSDELQQMSLIDEETDETNETIEDIEDNVNEGTELETAAESGAEENITDTNETDEEPEPDDGEEIVITVHEAVKRPVVKEETAEETPSSELSDEDDDSLDIAKYRMGGDVDNTYRDILKKLFPKDEAEIKQEDIDELAEKIDVRDEQDDEMPEQKTDMEAEREVDVTPSAITVNQGSRQPKPKKQESDDNGIDYSDILALAHMQGFKVRTADRTNFVPQGKLLINKLMALSSTLFAILLVAEAAALVFPLKDLIGISYTGMLYVLGGIFLFPLITYALLAINPNKTVDTITEMKFAISASFVAILNLLLLTFAIDLIIRIDFRNVRDVLLYLVFPFIAYLNIPMYFFIKYLLVSAGCCLTNDTKNN